MRFLCIHGACTNPEMMKVSISPFLKQLSNDDNISFYFAQGFLDSQPPQWLEPFLDEPPYLKFFQWDTRLYDVWDEAQVRKYGSHIPDKGWCREMEDEYGVDDGLRSVMFSEYLRNNPPESWSVGVALEYLRNVIEDEGPFDGLLGISEGAAVAATLLIQDMQEHKAKQMESPFRCAIFFIGAPGWSVDGTKPYLAEEHGQVIPVPTCHIMGAQDILNEAAEALLKTCNGDKAYVVSHPGGHKIPQDHETNKLVADWVRQQEREFLEG